MHAIWLTVLACVSTAWAAATPSVIFDFDKLSFPENIHLRPNGQLLVTCLTCSHVSQLDPNLGPGQLRRIVYTFPGALSVTGIVELEPDLYAVALGPTLNVTSGVLGSGVDSVWSLDLRQYKAPSYDSSQVVAKKLAGGGAAILFDGLAIINAEKGILAATDIFEGVLYRIDINSGKTTLLAADPLTLGSGGHNRTSTLSANGLKYKDGRLYFTNTILQILGYVPVDSETGEATGPVSTVYEYPFELDDFDIAPSGNIYLTTIATPVGGGIYRRAAGTPSGQNGTEQVVSRFGTNSVVTSEENGDCRIIFSAGLTFQVLRATIPGPC